MECRTLMGIHKASSSTLEWQEKIKVKEETLVGETADRRGLFKPYKTTPKQISILKEHSTALLLGVSHFSATFSHVHFCNILILEKEKKTKKQKKLYQTCGLKVRLKI